LKLAYVDNIGSSSRKSNAEQIFEMPSYYHAQLQCQG